MKIDIICPLYNAEAYIENLHASILKQKNVEIHSIKYILTESKDSSEKILNQLHISYEKIKKEEFSHSTVREKAAMASTADILVFITQDIDIRRDDWLYHLVLPIIQGEAEASFSKQITKYDNLEKYTREKNYPKESYVASKDSLETMGMRAFFFSDASSCIKTEIFQQLNGYDGKNLLINEDQYIAYKLIMNGYRIKYCSDSKIYHSHNFTIKELYQRYRDIGIFFGQNPYLDAYGTNKTGGNMAIYILKRAIQDRAWKVLIRFIPDMSARFLGMKIGKMKAKKWM